MSLRAIAGAELGSSILENKSIERQHKYQDCEMPNFGPGGGVFDRPGTMTGRPKALRRTEETILRHQQSPLGSAPPPARVVAFDRPGTMTGRPKRALRRTEEMTTRLQQSSHGSAPAPARVALCSAVRAQ